MKQEINPVVMIGVAVVVVVLLIVFAIHSLAPHPPQAAISPPGMQDEAALKRQIMAKKYAGQPPPAVSKPAGAMAGRTGD